MVPVWETGRTGEKGYSIQNFEHSFYEICDSHRREGRALLFAFLLAGETAPQIAKVLADKDYWEALDKEAGDRLSIFCFQVAPPEEVKKATSRKQLPARAMDYAYRVFGAKDRFLRHACVIADPEIANSLPCFLLFQIKDGRVSNHFAAALKERTVESVFNEIQDIVRAVVNALSHVEHDSHDLTTVFWLASESLKERYRIIVFKQFLSLVPYFEKVLKVFGHAAG